MLRWRRRPAGGSSSKSWSRPVRLLIWPRCRRRRPICVGARRARRPIARTRAKLLQQGRLPEAWAPPEEILELRQRVRLRKTLVDERTAWQQRIHALLFHHGIARPRALLTREGRASLQQLELSPSARQALDVALAMIDACEAQLAPLDRELRRYAHRRPGVWR
jgi:transposase